MQKENDARQFKISHRRRFLQELVGVGALAFTLPGGTVNAASNPAIPIIDSHIHIFNPNRPQGVPWPSKIDTILYRPALPDRYLGVTKGLGIVGAIMVECSPWFSDNQWDLNIAAKNPIIVGTVGYLEPGKPDFRKHLERFRRNPLFRGIRVWRRTLAEKLSNPDFVSDLKFLADAGMEMDTANPDAGLIASVVRVTDLVPTLRVVVDHLGQLEFPPEPPFRKALNSNLKELGKRPQVYIKVSEVVHRFALPLTIQHALDAVGGQVPYDLAFYRPQLDKLWDVFTEDQLMYGSDWPNSDHSAPITQELRIVREYVSTKERAAQEKFFWKNSLRAYRWTRRDPKQPEQVKT